MTDANPHHPLWSSDEHDAVSPKPSQHHARASTIPGNTFDLAPQTEPLLQISESEFPVPCEETTRPTSSLESYRIRISSSRGRIGQTSLWELIVQRRLRLLRLMKYSLETLIAIWAIYNCIRYLYSYSKFASSQGQAAALALAISSSLSLAFLGCATLLSAFKLPLSRSVPPRASHVIRKVLRPISTGLILAPAIFNVIFLCVWRDSDIPELSYKFRCYIDIDVIWSITGRQCVAPPWGIWLILAAIRLVVTLVVVGSYHVFSYAYGRTIRLSNARRQSLGLYETAETSSRNAHILTKEAPPNRNSQSQHRPSRSTLDSNVESVHTVIPYSASRNRIARSYSSSSSDDETIIRNPPGLGASTEENVDNLGDPLPEQFRTVVSQINQEMDASIRTSRSFDEEDPDNTPLPSPHGAYGFNLPSLPPTVGYNEFGQPYPPEEPLPILNAYIRRMPTIESMGSREMGSLASTNKEPRNTGSARSTLTFDRPPTRPLSFSEVTNSATSSRPNSFGLRAELFASLGGATELGELFERRGRREEADKLGSDQNHLDISNNPSTSRSTSTYYTATSGSLGPAGDSVS